MAKLIPDPSLQKTADDVATATTMTVCSAQPADYAGIAAVKLADTAMAGGDFTIGDGDTTGRKLTVAAKSNLTVTGTGTQNATHVALDDGTTLLAVTTCPTVALTNGNIANVASFALHIPDPV